MKISYASDLHLNFAPLELPGGDILILAGDIAESGHIRAATNAGKDMFLLDRYTEFFQTQCAKYNHVIYVFGNHEHYGNKYHDAVKWIKPLLLDNTVILNDSSITIDDTVFWGSTFWTDLNKANPVDMMRAGNSMSDYSCIKGSPEEHVPGQYRFTPATSVTMHKRSVRRLQDYIGLHAPKQMIVITHHAPHALSVPPWFEGDPLNSAYHSDQVNLILDNKCITHWIHGHIHGRSDYKIGNCRILANPRGYARYEALADNFEVKDV